jgi:hypothetical protein
MIQNVQNVETFFTLSFCNDVNLYRILYSRFNGQVWARYPDKVTSNKKIKGNRVSPNEGYFVVVKCSRENFSIKIDEILIGELRRDDWDRWEGT